jgi:hypothetical protein
MNWSKLFVLYLKKIISFKKILALKIYAKKQLLFFNIQWVSMEMIRNLS